jgi:hypothetical protein
VYQFDRVVTVQIGKLKGNAIEIKNLRTVFDVSKSSTDTYNECRVDIYNMSAATKNKLKDLDETLVLKAGYSSAGNEQVVFVGDITLINSDTGGADQPTTIEAKDGAKTMRQLMLSLSYKDGTSAKKVLKDVLNKSGLPLRPFDMSKIADKQYVNGFSFIGMGKELLSRVCTYLGLEWSIQNDEIKLVVSGKGDDTRIIQLNPNSGLVGSPKRIADISGSHKKGHTKIQGWKILSLLVPQMEPGSLVFVQSREIPTGQMFKVVELTHRGDTHGDSWITETVVAGL